MSTDEKEQLEALKKEEKKSSIYSRIRGHSDPIFNDPRLVQQHTLKSFPDMHKGLDEKI